MVLAVGLNKKTKDKIYYCPHCNRYLKSHEFYLKNKLGSNVRLTGVVCKKCENKTRRVSKGLPPVKRYKKYEKMKEVDPEKYHEIQKEKHEKQLKKVEDLLQVKPRPLTRGKLSDYQVVAERITNYLETTALGSDLDAIDRRTAVAPTMMGLANALGVTPTTIMTYKDKEFVEAEQMTIKAVITAALQMIAQFSEENIYTHNYQGAKFHLQKLVPEVFGDNEQGAQTVINIIDETQRDRVLNYIATRSKDKPEQIEFVE